MISPQKLLREYGFKPKKSLGQNFLVHAQSADKIATWSGVESNEWVLEIGPGLAALTEALSRKDARVIAVEKDPHLVEILQKQWLSQTPWAQLLHMDALNLDWSALDVPFQKKLRVVSNLPYSVSTPLVEKLMEGRSRLSSMCLLVQKEVVDRICAQAGNSDYGRLSIWVQTFCDVEKGPIIPPGSFFPVPDVDSALVRLTPRENLLVEESRVTSFLQFVALLFQHRRKTVRNSLRDARRGDWKVDPAIARIGLDSTRRPETLSIPELIELHDALN